MSAPFEIELLDDSAMIENIYGKDMVKTLLPKYQDSQYCFIRNNETKSNKIKEYNVKLT